MERVDQIYRDMVPIDEIIDILAPIFKVGADKGYEPNSWEEIPPDHHFGRGLAHFGHAMAGSNRDEDNIAHMMWRMVIGTVLVMRRRREAEWQRKMMKEAGLL